MIEQKDILRAYQRFLKLQRGYSANTLDAYLRDLQKLLDYLSGAWGHDAQQQPQDVLTVRLEDLQHFAAGLHDIGIHPR